MRRCKQAELSGLYGDIWIVMRVKFVSCDGFIEDSSEAENIGSPIGSISPGLFRAHVIEFTLDLGGIGHLICDGDSKIRNFNVAIHRKKDVFRADVAVNGIESVP